MKFRLGFIVVSFGAIIFANSCTTNCSSTIGPTMGSEFNDSNMFYICEYFREINGKWPSDTPDLINFLENNYTNMLDRIKTTYMTAEYETASDGSLMIKRKGDHWFDTTYIRSNSTEPRTKK